ncbi:unnamed protein product [Tuber melanosporum]|uniref:(Perigord truffle) hypothetical protein n=1 Tax=Tuber melanosporum (strain Mel28) TaxID=656061 RepID=D5G7U3_TUBMM|nr:uncharacterized protein GSTUM_00002654001 [Tuber melanosporum]CAZ80586.1 unnamed protein product [Tuber melanosporum]
MWANSPPRSSSPDRASDSIPPQPSSSASSTVSTSATNQSTVATSLSITPDRETLVLPDDTIISKPIDSGKHSLPINAEQSDVRATEEPEAGPIEVDGAENATEDVKEEHGDGRSGAQEQTRTTRNLRHRSRTVGGSTPSTPAPTKPTKGSKAAPDAACRRSLRSADKPKPPNTSDVHKAKPNATRRHSQRIQVAAATAAKLAATTTPAPSRGKRSHEVMAAGSKSAGPKLQNSVPATVSTVSSKPDDDAPRSSKRARKVLSYDEDKHDEQLALSLTHSTSGALATNPRKRKKIWLNQGLYLGQEQDIDVTRRPSGGSRKRGKATEKKKPSVLPMPMFTGSRIMETERDFKLPFNVFAPSPWRCGPIPDWRKLNHNVLIGDAASHWRKEKASTAKCVCAEEVGCDENCLNMCTWVECDEGNCNVGVERCTNRAFADLKERVKSGTKFAEGVEVVKTANCGHGLRATRGFMPNQIIVEYTGEIITQEESERRMVEVYKDNKNYYLMLFHQNMILDATRGSVARFVNHSCDPNCRMEKWLVEGRPRMALFAGDDGIEAGEELTYDYNFNWFTGVSQQTCHCGADNCRGALGKKADGFQRASPPVKGKDKAKGKAGAAPRSKQASAKVRTRVAPKSKVAVKGKATAKTRAAAKTTKITRPIKSRTTMAARGKGVIRATVRETAVRTQRSVRAGSSRVRGMEAGEIEAAGEAEAVEKDSEQSDMEGLESIRVASSPGQAVLSDLARKRIRNRGGKPRVTKTYKVGKTIRAKYYKGKLGPRKKAIQDAITPLLASESSPESATITVATTARTYREIAPKPPFDAEASSSMSSTSGTSVSGRVGVRRSVRKSAAPNAGQNTVQTFEALVAGHPTTALSQALNTVLATSVESEALATGVGLLGSVECTV